METINIIILNYYFSCNESFLNEIQDQVLFIVPATTPNVPFELKMLCGDEFWKPLSTYKKILAGMCMVYLVEHQLVPFVLAPTYRKNPYPNRYLLINN